MGSIRYVFLITSSRESRTINIQVVFRIFERLSVNLYQHKSRNWRIWRLRRVSATSRFPFVQLMMGEWNRRRKSDVFYCFSKISTKILLFYLFPSDKFQSRHSLSFYEDWWKNFLCRPPIFTISSKRKKACRKKLENPSTQKNTTNQCTLAICHKRHNCQEASEVLFFSIYSYYLHSIFLSDTTLSCQEFLPLKTSYTLPSYQWLSRKLVRIWQIISPCFE